MTRSRAFCSSVRVEYAAASMDGDVPLAESELDAPFLTEPKRPHPVLTLRDYFQALECFIKRCLGPEREGLEGVPASPWNPDQIIIRSEKHGAFAHIASIDLISGIDKIKICASTALKEEGNLTLHNEYHILRRLRKSHGLPYLPRPMALGDTTAGPGGQERLSILLTDWFEGFHEWHLHPGDPGSPPGIQIWDQEYGHRPAAPEEIHRIFEEAARILTLYYHPETFCQITPWHHAAGDFIVRSTPESTEMRLCTARGFRPLPGITTAEADPHVALVYFLLNTALRMRLDRRDGLEEPVWAGETAVKSTVKGFLRAVESTRAASRAGIGRPGDLLALLCSFSPEELARLHAPLISLYREGDPEEKALMEDRLPDHSLTLFRVFREARESGPREAR
ncbi:MAG: hypothetical protein ACLFUP_06670 [Desulfobacteraceae bacterium]